MLGWLPAVLLQLNMGGGVGASTALAGETVVLAKLASSIVLPWLPSAVVLPKLASSAVAPRRL